MGRRVTFRAGRGDPRQGGDRVAVRRKGAGWVEVRSWRGQSEQALFLRDGEASVLAGLLAGGPPWDARGRVAVEAAGEWVRVVVGRGSSKPPRTLSLRPGGSRRRCRSNTNTQAMQVEH